MFTAPYEWIDGEGDGIDREMSLINRMGRIRIVDKDRYGEALTTRSTEHRNTKPPDHEARLKAHTVRIRRELSKRSENNLLKDS